MSALKVQFESILLDSQSFVGPTWLYVFIIFQFSLNGGEEMNTLLIKFDFKQLRFVCWKLSKHSCFAIYTTTRRKYCYMFSYVLSVVPTFSEGYRVVFISFLLNIL